MLGCWLPLVALGADGELTPYTPASSEVIEPARATWTRSHPRNVRAYLEVTGFPAILFNTGAVSAHVEYRHGWVALSVGGGAAGHVGLTGSIYSPTWESGYTLGARGQIHVLLGGGAMPRGGFLEAAFGLGPVYQSSYGPLERDGWSAFPSFFLGGRWEKPGSRALYRCGSSLGLGTLGLSCSVGVKPPP